MIWVESFRFDDIGVFRLGQLVARFTMCLRRQSVAFEFIWI
jgi:hypothetical protein